MIKFRKSAWPYIVILILMSLLISPSLVFAQEDKVELSLSILRGYYYRDVIPGEENVLYMEVRNNGDKEITNIVFVSDNPEGWVVDFKPSSINHLGSGSSQTVDVSVIPSRDTSRGEYHLTFLAEADETRTATSTMLRVENGSSFWLWVGLGAAALAIAGFIFIYLRFGRQ